MKLIKLMTYFGWLILSIFLNVAADGQDTYNRIGEFKSSLFQIDFAQFKSDEPDLVRLEVYYKIFNKELQFVRDGSNYRAEYELTVTTYDDDNRQLDAFSKDKTVIVYSYESTVSISDFRISQFDLKLPPGKYKIEVHIIDKNAGTDSRRIIKPELHDFNGRYADLSGIEFVHAVDTSVIDSSFLKGNMTIIPSVSRQFTGDTTARMLYYFEIYQGTDEQKEVFVESKILGRKLEAIYYDSMTSVFPEGQTLLRQIREISLNKLKSNDYYVEITLTGRRGRQIDRVSEKFNLYWHPRAMVLNDFETAVSQLKYIARSDEIKKLKDASTPEERVEKWEGFWTSHDPSPGTPENELQRDYYNRIAFANLNFGILKKEGWRTDRGMIFIQYGFPDQIEDFPFELDSKAYQIWYYYQPVSSFDEPSSEPRKFIFVDDWGDGDFRLQYPYDGRRW